MMERPLGTKLYYSIGEVAELTQLAPYTLRAWEREFTCLRPRRIRGKNRAYRDRDIRIVLLIKRLLHEERYSIRGAQLKLKNEPHLIRGAVDSAIHGGGPVALAAMDSGAGRDLAPNPPTASGAAGEDVPALLRDLCGELRRILDLLG